MSDIHFDPFADPRIAEGLVAEPVDRWRSIFAAGGEQQLAQAGHETNDALLESTLDAIHTNVDPSVVFITGDFLAHGFRASYDRVSKARDDASYDAFVDKTIAFLAMEFREAFPRARLLPVIGNNDGYCGDYQSTPHSPFLSHMASYWGPAASSDTTAWMDQFATGGYYEVPLPAGNAQAIVLNDVFWSARYANACGDPHADPGNDELTWLTQTLKAAGNNPVWIVAHIPPGVDAYSTITQRGSDSPVMFLADRFNAAFIAALAAQPPPIAMALTAHTHAESFRIIDSRASTPATPMLIVPSVSPIFGGAPSFTVLDVDAANASVLDEHVFAEHDGKWRREYDFDGHYGAGVIDATHLSEAQRRIFDDDKPHKATSEAAWRAYWCASVALTAVDYLACASPTVQTSLPPHPSPPPTPTPSPTPIPSATP